MTWPFFSHKELACRHCGEIHMDAEFMTKVVQLRRVMKFPFPITSGFRCHKHNASVGGSPTSGHVLGRAVDIQVYGQRAFELIHTAPDFGITGIGIKQHGPYSGRFIHLDDLEEGRPTIWSYT